jgi:hypothetical protein
MKCRCWLPMTGFRHVVGRGRKVPGHYRPFPEPIRPVYRIRGSSAENAPNRPGVNHPGWMSRERRRAAKVRTMGEEYEIKVSGALGLDLRGAFDGMRCDIAPRQTTIRGRLSPDELRHLLLRLDQFGVELVYMTRARP